MVFISLKKKNKLTSFVYFRHVRVIALLLLAVIILGGCSRALKEKAFREILPMRDINHKIVLTDKTILQGTTASDCGAILLINQSEDAIRFPINFGTRLLTFDTKDNTWVELENTETYDVIIEGMDVESSKRQIEKDGGLLITPKGTITNMNAVHYCPNLQGYQLPVTVRVMVVGAIENHPDDKVAAYYDVKIEP